MQSTRVKLVVFVPISHADAIRRVLGETGAGKIGNYDFCSFSIQGIGRFRPNQNAKPLIGEANVIEAVKEERIETIVARSVLQKVITKIRAVHPYEEIAFDIYSLEDE